MNYLDWFFLFVLGSGMVWGYQNGLIKSILGFLGIGIAIWIGFKFSNITEEFVSEIDAIPHELISVVSLIFTIVLIYFAVKLIAKILHSVTHTIGLGIFNRLGGVLFGLLLNAVMLSSLVYYVLPILGSLIDPEIVSQSKILPHLREIIELFKVNFHLFSDLKNSINESA